MQFEQLISKIDVILIRYVTNKIKSGANLTKLCFFSRFQILVNNIEQRCPTHSPLASCGEWPFKCGE